VRSKVETGAAGAAQAGFVPEEGFDR